MKGHVVWENTDKTEGRGHQVVKAVCRTKATARRLGSGGDVQGNDCKVTEEDLEKRQGVWWGPIRLAEPSKEDEAAQQQIDNAAKARDMCEQAGFDPEQVSFIVDSLSRGRP